MLLERIALGDPGPGEIGFDELLRTAAPDAAPRASAEDWSVMLYTSGTTSRPKGVPRRWRMWRRTSTRMGSARWA